MKENIQIKYDSFQSEIMSSNKSHPSYYGSVLDIGLAPEYNTGEVMLAALYRQVGWQRNTDKWTRFSEKSVNTESTMFFNKIHAKRQKRNDSIIDQDDWVHLLHNGLASPKMSKQSKSKKPILYPLVPDCALYANAARLRGNPWNPGNLLEQLILNGCESKDNSEALWSKLFDKLGADSSDLNEDIWARLVSEQFSNSRSEDVRWALNKLSRTRPEIGKEIFESSPAKAFAIDLRSILELKTKLTRRQWLATLESLVRIGSVSHVLWLCKLNYQIWAYLKKCLLASDSKELELKTSILEESSALWKLDEHGNRGAKSIIRHYLHGRVAINTLLFEYSLLTDSDVSLNTLGDMQEFGGELFKLKEAGKILPSKILERVQSLLDADPAVIACKKGVSKNIFEFVRHTIGQKNTANPAKRSYDQSYWMRKKGSYSAAPWIIDLGPTSILTMVYCCSHGYDQNRTVQDLFRHIGKYGLIVDLQDLQETNLLDSLRTLQIVVDSPDAEGGMIIINPFSQTN